jgi:hypothetical protein
MPRKPRAKRKYVLTLYPRPDGPDWQNRPPAYRLKILLKIALRSFGLVCKSCREEPLP